MLLLRRLWPPVPAARRPADCCGSRVFEVRASNWCFGDDDGNGNGDDDARVSLVEARCSTLDLMLPVRGQLQHAPDAQL